MASLEPGDAPMVRDLLVAHFSDPLLEVEGKLGRRSSSKERFTAGVSAEQFARLEQRLLSGAPELGIAAGAEPPAEEVTVDRFFATASSSDAREDQAAADREDPQDLPAEQPQGGAAGQVARRAPRRRVPTVRSSFACDKFGAPLGEPIEVLNKTRLSDCHVGRLGAALLPPEGIVDLRVSFSQEAPVSLVADAPLVYERNKRRRTFEADLWQIMMTRVVIGSQETFEVELELRMRTVRPRLLAAPVLAEEALRITREFVAALRVLSGWASEVVGDRKRKRLEDLQAADSELRAATAEPEVHAELCRCIRGGRAALRAAKDYLRDVLRIRFASLDEADLQRFAGRQVARMLKEMELEGDTCSALHGAAAEDTTVAG